MAALDDDIGYRMAHHDDLTGPPVVHVTEVENGIDTSSFGGDEGFARMVTETLSNPKSWTHNPQIAFAVFCLDGNAYRTAVPVTVKLLKSYAAQKPGN